MTPNAPTVLVVDDTEAARYTKCRTLRHAGLQVLEAQNGAAALRMVEEHRPQLAMLDVRLPDMLGTEVCRIVKERWPRTMVLQTSATFITPADRVRGLEGGADVYLIEPVDPSELVAAVHALLRLHASEEQTRQLAESLERRVEERTRDLQRANIKLIEQIAQREKAEASLLQAQKMEAVGQLTGAMAHDFNNILASMTGYIHLVRRLTGDAKLQGLLGSALAAADRGKRLTARLLAFSRSDALPTRSVDVGGLVAGMQDWLQQTVGSTIRLEVRADDAQCVAETDANQLELALLNLALNARDAMAEGGELTIAVERRVLADADDDLKPGRYVVLTVGDSGTGMPSDVLMRAFDPFFTTKPRGRGTGLGLVQVYTLARQSGGSARIDSSEGSGTRVAIWLAAGDPATLGTSGAGSVAGNSGRGETVLVVDDEADIRGTVSQLLDAQGYHVLSANGASDALAEIERAPPDLLLLDYAMPGMSGLELALKVRERLPELPIVFISGHAERSMLESAVPGARLLLKPFDNDELNALIRRSLDADAPTA